MSKTTQQELESELQKLRDAYWSYILEHCEVQEGGTMFVKFHTRTRTMFEGHVNARMKNYHREDPVKKEEFIIKKQEDFKTEKARKSYIYKLNKKLRKEKMSEIQKAVEKVAERNRRIARSFVWRLYYTIKDKYEKHH